MDWTAYGKVRDVTVGSTVTKFRYDAVGNRAIKPTVGDYNKTTHYVRDASGNVLATTVQATYINGVLSARTLYGSSRLGKLVGDPRPQERVPGSRYYELTNHLGNVMGVLSDSIGRTAAKRGRRSSAPATIIPLGWNTMPFLPECPH